MIHKITKQWLSLNLTDVHLGILKLIVQCLLTYSSDYFELVDIRRDMYLYSFAYTAEPSKTYSIKLAYIIRDKVSGLYLYFFYCPIIYLDMSYSICFTMSVEYDSSKNIIRQEGSPKIYGVTSSPIDKTTGFPKANTYKGECYGYLQLLLLKVSATNIDTLGDFYFIANGRSFSVILDASYQCLGRYDNESATYFTYDASVSYHSFDKRIVSVHTSNTYFTRTGASQKNVDAEIADRYCSDPTNENHLPNDVCLTYVPCDVFDTKICSFYSTASEKLITFHRWRNVPDYYYVIDSDVELKDSTYYNVATVPPKGLIPMARKDDVRGAPRDYEEPPIDVMFVGACVSYFDNYHLRRQFQILTAAEIMYRTNSDFNYLDTNSGTNYYSGMLSTLNSSTIAIPNFVSVLREPVELGTMSPVQESTFMYLVDMSKIQTGEVVEVIDNKGNKINLICFPTHMGEIVPSGDKLFGVGFKYEDVVQTEDYLNIKDMEANSGKSVMTLLNAKNRVSAYLGDVDFKDYQRGTILLNYSYGNVESIEIAYTDMDGDYIQKVSWMARDFIDRMESGESFDLLRSNNNGDYWYIDPIKSTDTVLISGLKNCGIVSISCNRRK